MGLPRRKKNTYPVLNNQNLLKGETKAMAEGWAGDIMWALKGALSKVPQKSFNPWSMKSREVLPALTFNYLHPGTAEPLDSPFPQTDKHTHGCLFPSLPSHSLAGQGCLPSNSHKLGIKPRESCLKDCHQPPALQAKPLCKKKKKIKMGLSP